MQLKITTKLLACLKTENSKVWFFFKHLYSLFLTLKKVHISSYKLTSVVYICEMFFKQQEQTDHR